MEVWHWGLAVWVEQPSCGGEEVRWGYSGAGGWLTGAVIVEKGIETGAIDVYVARGADA